AVVYAPQVVRVVRAAAMGVAPLDYVTAARARGERTLSILLREVLPNIADVVAVEFAMRASWVVLLISSLSFLGFGANPPTPDWGLMVSENRTAMVVVPWASLAPIIALATLVVGLNLPADGLAKAWGVARARAAPRAPRSTPGPRRAGTRGARSRGRCRSGWTASRWPTAPAAPTCPWPGTSASRWPPARRWPSSASPAAASRRWPAPSWATCGTAPGCCPGLSRSLAGTCSRWAAGSCARSARATSPWWGRTRAARSP